ncbi:MAG: AI-2E family transporter [Desulfuromonadaceae bacterium]|nr:AI-2E family transporter [Desulfuromonadaceae bacterium]
MDKKIYLSILAAFATLFAVWLFYQLAAPIVKPFAWALVIGIATLPNYDRLAKRFPDRAAGLMVLAITVCFMLPVAAIAVMVAENAADWYTEGQRFALTFSATGSDTLKQVPFAQELLSLADRFNIDVHGFIIKLTHNISGYLVSITTNAAKNLGDFLFTLVAALFILYYIYRDGERILTRTITRFSTTPDTAYRYFEEVRATTTAVTVGTLLTCLVQGVIAGLGYFVTGAPAPFLFGALTSVAALVPVIGTAIIWVPLALLVAISGTYLKAGLLVLWCIIFVGLADNAIRPLAIGAKSNIPTLAIVLGATCGAIAMGILGLILGPVIFAIIFTAWQDVTEAVHPGPEDNSTSECPRLPHKNQP